MEKVHGIMDVFVLSCMLLTCKLVSYPDGKIRLGMRLRVSTKTCMYFLHLVLTFTPHYIITDKGLFSLYLIFTYLANSFHAHGMQSYPGVH